MDRIVIVKFVIWFVIVNIYIQMHKYQGDVDIKNQQTDAKTMFHSDIETGHEKLAL